MINWYWLYNVLKTEFLSSFVRKKWLITGMMIIIVLRPLISFSMTDDDLNNWLIWNERFRKHDSDDTYIYILLYIHIWYIYIYVIYIYIYYFMIYTPSTSMVIRFNCSASRSAIAPCWPSTPGGWIAWSRRCQLIFTMDMGDFTIVKWKNSGMDMGLVDLMGFSGI